MSRAVHNHPSVVRRAIISAVGDVDGSMGGLAAKNKLGSVVRKVIGSEGGFSDHHTTDNSDIHYAALKNMGTHSEVAVEVGTPGQRFSVVADTGSNNLIVPSCACQELTDSCAKGDPCFTGEGKSETFLLVRDENATDGAMHSDLAFGSGTVSGVIAHDNVTLGSLSHRTEGIFLMTDSQLDVQIGGILGLGVPGSNAVMDESEQAWDEGGGYGAEDVLKHMGGGRAGKIAAKQSLPRGRDALPRHQHSRNMSRRQGRRSRGGRAHYLSVAKKQDLGHSYPGFLEQADVAHFSMCFNQGKDGWLALSKTVPSEHQGSCLPNIGKAHWGIGLHGISVASKDSLLQTSLPNVCTETKAGHVSPCGAIPDSGTTVITGPQADIDKLHETICDHWPRCQQNYTALIKAKTRAKAAEVSAAGKDIFGIDDVQVTKQDVLENVLADCESWMKPSLAEGSLNELPALKFKLCGDGKCQELELPGHLYVIEERDERGSDGYDATPEYRSKAAASHGAAKESHGAAKAKKRALSRGASKVCSCAFDAMDMQTSQTGPVWILGTPFFYAYKVGYSLAKAPTKSSLAVKSQSVIQNARAGASNCISFTETKDASPCDAPASAKSSDVVSDTSAEPPMKIGSLPESVGTSGSKLHQPLKITGPWRRPSRPSFLFDM
jgi:hypothetical protein